MNETTEVVLDDKKDDNNFVVDMLIEAKHSLRRAEIWATDDLLRGHINEAIERTARCLGHAEALTAMKIKGAIK